MTEPMRQDTDALARVLFFQYLLSCPLYHRAFAKKGFAITVGHGASITGHSAVTGEFFVPSMRGPQIAPIVIGHNGHKVLMGGHLVGAGGHWVTTDGHNVFTGVHEVSGAGHFVCTIGQVVGDSGHLVFSTGHLVFTAGHCVSTGVH